MAKRKKKVGADRSASEYVFESRVLDRAVLALPLIRDLAEENPADGSTRENPRIGASWKPRKKPWTAHRVIIDVNLQYKGGRVAARHRIWDLIAEILATPGRTLAKGQGIDRVKCGLSQQYLFASLEGWAIQELVRRDAKTEAGEVPGEARQEPSEFGRRAVYRIWPDFKVRSLTNKTVSTVKVDAARNAFAAVGEGVVWAVMDSGVDAAHPHFKLHGNLKLPEPLKHQDFAQTLVEIPKVGRMGSEDSLPPSDDPHALLDKFGHGTHVAGIIAGEATTKDSHPPQKDAPRLAQILARTHRRDENGGVTDETVPIDAISGMAPKCKLLSLKVLDDGGRGSASSLIAAIEAVQKINGYGRRLLIHGVNMSVGYDFEPEWFACGQSPLCVEVDRLVKSGVVVVVAAGNTGYGWQNTAFRGNVAAGMELSINDPGNADLAITVGSTHRDMPHTYGVSYFSSKGPTGDGRMKPDLVAPGEKVISCMSKDMAGGRSEPQKGFYREESGTSMAAPHVSGVVAAFLSVRREFIGKPEEVKRIFLNTATDLKRSPQFQGRGLIDLMRAIQSV